MNVAVFFTLNRISLDCARSFFARITIKDVPTFTCLFSMTFLSFHRVGEWRGEGGTGQFPLCSASVLISTELHGDFANYNPE